MCLEFKINFLLYALVLLVHLSGISFHFLTYILCLSLCVFLILCMYLVFIVPHSLWGIRINWGFSVWLRHTNEKSFYQTFLLGDTRRICAYKHESVVYNFQLVSKEKYNNTVNVGESLIIYKLMYCIDYIITI